MNILLIPLYIIINIIFLILVLNKKIKRKNKLIISLIAEILNIGSLIYFSIELQQWEEWLSTTKDPGYGITNIYDDSFIFGCICISIILISIFTVRLIYFLFENTIKDSLNIINIIIFGIFIWFFLMIIFWDFGFTIMSICYISNILISIIALIKKAKYKAIPIIILLVHISLFIFLGLNYEDPTVYDDFPQPDIVTTESWTPTEE
jgi:hypothetical protein